MISVTDWEQFKAPDGSFDLCDVYKYVYELDECPLSVILYLCDVHTIRPIKSRQAAAIAVVTAHALRGT